MKKTILFAYDGDGQLLLLEEYFKFKHLPGTEAEASELGYRQLWLLAWRLFPELSKLSPRREKDYPQYLSSLDHTRKRELF